MRVNLISGVPPSKSRKGSGDRNRVSKKEIGHFLIVDKPYKNMLNVGYVSVSQERRRLTDRLGDDRNAHDLFKGFLGKCND